MTRIRTGTLSACAAVVLGCLSPAQASETIRFESSTVASYPALYAGDLGPRVTLEGRVSLPAAASGPMPAAILMHSAGGPDPEHEAWYEKSLNGQGIATLAVDSFGGRGLRPPVSVRALSFPSLVADIYNALRALAADHRFDAGRIAVIGFSRGAEAARQAAFEAFRKGATGGKGLRLAAHVAFYPLCVTSADGNHAFTGAPVLILGGEADEGTPVANCRATVAYFKHIDANAPLRLAVYARAHHGWDAPRLDGYYPDAPGTRDCVPILLSPTGEFEAMVKEGRRVALDRAMLRCPGQGYTMKFDASIRERSTAEMLAFLKPILLRN